VVCANERTAVGQKKHESVRYHGESFKTFRLGHAMFIGGNEGGRSTYQDIARWTTIDCGVAEI
jgi:hypothetical protein